MEEEINAVYLQSFNTCPEIDCWGVGVFEWEIAVLESKEAGTSIRKGWGKHAQSVDQYATNSGQPNHLYHFGKYQVVWTLRKILNWGDVLNHLINETLKGWDETGGTQK